MKGGTLEASGEPLARTLETLPELRGVVDDADVEDVSAAAYGLFGRDEVLRSLHQTLLEGGSAVVTGEPGLGKSSLLKVTDQLAQRAGHRVLAVTPTPFDRGLPFSGLAELVAQVPKGVDRALPEPQRRALAVALREQDPEGHEADPLAVQLAVRTLLTELCGSGSVTLIVDDLQWLDSASAASLGFGLRRLAVEPGRLSVLVGTRPAAGIGAELTSGLPGPVNDIRLAPLEDWAMGQLLREHLGARWTPPMSSGVTRASGGNPFLGLMIAQAMQSDLSQWWWNPHDGSDPVFPMPPSLAEILGEKVSLLPATAREVLLLVSAAGRLTVAQLAGAFDEARLADALDAAADWDVATVGPGAVVGFTHPMLASAIYDAASPAERRRAHKTLADLIDDPVERARHRARTVTTPLESVAEELERAAETSRSRGAQALAGELWEAAARATPGDGRAAFGRWLAAIDCYLAAGDGLAAQGVIDNSLASLTLSGEEQAELAVRRIALTDDVAVARSLAEEALAAAPVGTAVRPRLQHLLGSVERLQGEGRRALELSRAAVEEAAAMGLDEVRLAALSGRLSVERHWGTGDVESTLAEIDHLASTMGLDARSADLAWIRGFHARWDDPDAETQVRRGIAAAIESGRYGDLSGLYTALVVVLVRASRILDAQLALAEADRAGAWAPSQGQQEHIVRIFVQEYAGNLDEARELARIAAKDPEIRASTYWRAAFLTQLGFIEASARNWQAAIDPLREVAAIFDHTGMVDLEQLLWAVDYADAALQLGETDEVERAIAVLRRQGEAGHPEALAAADRCQALLTASRGDVDAALHDLVAVVEGNGVECPFEAARSRLALGQVYRRAGYKAIATETLGMAAEVFDELGIPRWAERARDDAGRVGLQPSNGGLTETERRVAELVASGHSNQETAAELFISVKTVEANLTRIYRKLAVRSRTELANRLNHPGSGEPGSG